MRVRRSWAERLSVVVVLEARQLGLGEHPAVMPIGMVRIGERDELLIARRGF